VEGSILALLAEHGSLGYEQIAAHSQASPETVRNALTDPRDGGLVDVLSVGELEGHSTRATLYSRLTEKGRAELERLRRQ
jgi:DNA-binding transcriptional ArsR family regulator